MISAMYAPSASDRPSSAASYGVISCVIGIVHQHDAVTECRRAMCGNMIGNALNQKISWISIGVPRNRYT